MKDQFAPNIIVGFARLGGQAVGLVANNPDEMGGVMENDCSDKYMRMLMFCNAFNLPIITLVDTPGFVVGREWEDKGILRHGAKLLYGYAIGDRAEDLRDHPARVRRRQRRDGLEDDGRRLLLRLAHGRDLDHGPGIGGRRDLGRRPEAGEDLGGTTPRCSRRAADEYRERYINIFSLAENHRFDFVDDIIDPRDTRAVLIRALQALEHKQVDLPRRKNGNPPQ